MSVNFTISPNVQNVLAELEIDRKKIVAVKTKNWGIILLGVIALLGISSLGFLIAGLIVAIPAVIYGAIKLFKVDEEVGAYRVRFKHDVIGATLSAANQSFTFTPNDGISETEFVNSQLFTTTPDRYSTEDLITGKIDKTSIYFAEVHAEYKTETQTKNGRKVTWHDIIKGIIFTADFNKHFNGATVIRPKDFGSTFGAWFSKNIYSFGDKNVVELENDAFNKTFIVYSTDQVEARYILTPALMERIGSLNQRTAYTVSLSFINSAMYIAFPLDQNYFEPPIFKTLLAPDLLSKDLSVLKFMYDIVHELDLNTRIWTKA